MKYDVIKVKWLDICFFSGVSEDYLLEQKEEPIFTSIGLDFGTTEFKGKKIQKVCYNTHQELEDQYSIVYIPTACIVEKEVLGETEL